MHFATSRALYLSAFLTGATLTGCHRAPSPDRTAEISQLNAELEGTRQKLAAADKELESKSQAINVVTGIAETTKKQLGEKAQAIAQLEAQVRAMQTEL